MSAIISKKDVSFPKSKNSDDLGRVFEWQGRIFRAIYPGQEGHAHSLISSGLLQELMSQGYIPNTWLTDYQMEGYGLILEHERLWPVVYPQEWTFYMLKDAALFVYEVWLVARRHGFNMKDAHGFNVLYDGASPKFSDLGTFTSDIYAGWMSYEEFLEFYYYPLRIWQHNRHIGKLSILAGQLNTHETYLDYQYPLFRKLSPNLQRRIIDLSVSPSLAAQSRRVDARQLASSQKPSLRTCIKQVAGKLIPIESLELNAVVERIRKLERLKGVTEWENYHENIVENAKRFGRIIEILNSLEGNLHTAVDIGGNQGRFSRQLLEQTSVTRVACIDADENAIENGYNREKTTKASGITFGYFDFMERLVKLNSVAPDIRFKGDVVFALALSHHLILAQKYDLDVIFERISSYATQYVFIEFMPLGLWSTGHEPNVPDWYSVQWFRDAFIQLFELLHEEKLMANRILFVGKVRR